MKSIKLHTKPSTWLLALFLVIPTLAQFHHSFVNHPTNLVQKEGINQLENKISCAVFHHLFTIKSNLGFTSFDVIAPLFQKSIILKFNYLRVIKQLLFKISRGPPSLIF